MDPAGTLAAARRRAGLTQRELAERASVPQSTVGRIESGTIDPRASTLDALLRLCRYELEALPRLGEGVDRTQIREQLGLTPRERLEVAAQAAAFVSKTRGIARRKKART